MPPRRCLRRFRLNRHLFLDALTWVVGLTYAWLHQFKRLRIRYERRADLHQALLELACSIICLRRLPSYRRKIARRGKRR